MQSTIHTIIAVEARQQDKHRFTSMIPAHYSISDALYREGVYFGSQQPLKGAFFHIPGEEPTIGLVRNEQLSSFVPKRFVIITPISGNGLTLKNLLFPDATTHNFKRNRANEAYKIQTGSVLLVGDASGAMSMALYCFHDPVAQGSTLIR